MSRGCPILMYHYVGATTDPEDIPYTVPTERFAAQLAYLSSRGFRTVTLSAVHGWIERSERLPRWALVITFDDGHESVYREAFPLLKHYGFCATVFLIASRVGQRRFLNIEQIREMQASGISFESHTSTHRSLTSLGPEAAREELMESRCDLENLLGTPVGYLAYPYGHFNEEVKFLARETGYRGAVCSKHGVMKRGIDPFAMTRIPVRPADDPAGLSRKISESELLSRARAAMRRVLTRWNRLTQA